MIEFLTQTISWWHWVILGILLIIAEMGTGTFILLGFGLAAIAVGFIDLILPISFLFQLIFWIILAITLVGILFKYFKKQTISSSTGQSDHGFDTQGTVTKDIEPHHRGEVHFDHPVLGNTLWHASSDHKLKTGDRVGIEAVNGQLIKVVPLNK